MRMRWISVLVAMLFLSPVMTLIPSASATPYIIHGQVTWGDGLSPVSGAVVTITNIDRDPEVYTMSTTTDSNGYYGLSPGLNEPGDFANESQRINITVTYTTSDGQVVHAYADPIVVGSPEETAADHTKEINFSLTPVDDSSTNSGFSSTLAISVVVVAAILVLLLFLFRRKGGGEREGRGNAAKGR